MDIKGLILKKLTKKKTIKVADIVKATGFSRAYINRFFQELRNEGKIVLVGKANKARYVLARKKALTVAKRELLSIKRVLKNKNLSEDLVLNELKNETGIFLDLPKNVSTILDYAFTEMLNNAIEHSRSRKIEINMQVDSAGVRFDVTDFGVGIFRHIMKKRGLESELEAIRDLLKGKQTTAPKEHSGEGIFFTSRVADMLTIRGSKKKLIFHNILEDIFIKDIKPVKGTKVTFFISLKSKKKLSKIFREYSIGSYEFGKTKVTIRLYKMDTDYISRSQARRLMSGLDDFKKITLDFKKVETVGQSFVDEVFRVWQSNHPYVELITQNINENIDFMIKRVLKRKLKLR